MKNTNREPDSKLEPFKDDITRAHESGETSIIIAKRYGVSKTTVVKALRAWGIEVKSSSKLDPFKDDIIDAYESGEASIAIIAERYNVSRATILTKLNDWGVEVSRSGHRKIDPFKNDIIQAYESGETAIALAKQYGVSYKTIYTRLHQWGVKLHSGKKH